MPYAMHTCKSIIYMYELYNLHIYSMNILVSYSNFLYYSSKITFQMQYSYSMYVTLSLISTTYVSVYLCNSMCTVSGAGWSAWHTWDAVAELLVRRPLDTVKVCVPGVLFLVQNNLLFTALSNLDAATYQAREHSWPALSCHSPLRMFHCLMLYASFVLRVIVWNSFYKKMAYSLI